MIVQHWRIVIKRANNENASDRDWAIEFLTYICGRMYASLAFSMSVSAMGARLMPWGVRGGHNIKYRTIHSPEARKVGPSQSSRNAPITRLTISCGIIVLVSALGQQLFVCGNSCLDKGADIRHNNGIRVKRKRADIVLTHPIRCRISPSGHKQLITMKHDSCRSGYSMLGIV